MFLKDNGPLMAEVEEKVKVILGIGADSGESEAPSTEE